MNKTTPWQPRRVPRKPSSTQLSQEEEARQKVKEDELAKKSQAIFEKIRPSLIQDHYDWFIIIEPESGDYFIDPEESIVIQKMREKHPHTWAMILRINETGACGRI